MSSIFFTDADNNLVDFDIKPIMPEMQYWELQCGIHYSGMVDGKPYHVEVPCGFITDGASIPEFLQPAVGGPWGVYGPGAVVHDYGYRHNRYSRRIWDLIFNDIMKITDVRVMVKKTPTWTRLKIYWGLLLGGWKTWNNYRRADVKRVA